VTGGCTALSGEVGYIAKANGRFLYSKGGVPANSAQVWDVPYYTNNAAWNSEAQLTGAQARLLLSKPGTALIRGKVQPYTTQRAGSTVSVALPESDDVISIPIDPRAIRAAGGLILDIRGVANERLYLSVGGVSEDSYVVKELFSVRLDGGGLEPIRYGGLPIRVDPIGGMDGGMVYGTVSLPEGTALVRVDTEDNGVTLLATVEQSVWHFVATEEYVLYEIPAAAAGKPRRLGCAKIGE
jgi:hypothetical protein